MSEYRRECSVIIPCYNAEKYILNCLESLECDKQWAHSIEVIVIDDGSLDETANIVLEYAKNRKEICLFSKENAGVSSARNIGLEHATGKYIYFADSDDCVIRSTLEEMLTAFESTNADLLIADYYHHYQKENKTTKISSKIPYNQLLDRNYIETTIFKRIFTGDSDGLSNLWNKVYKSSVIKDNGLRFDVQRTHGEDWAFNILYLEKINTLYAVEKPIYTYQLDGSQRYEKYNKGLAYGLIEGHKLLSNINRKYSICVESSNEHLMFMGQFLHHSLHYLKLDNCGNAEKRKFLFSPEEQALYRYLLKLNSTRLGQIGHSRRAKIAFLLLKYGFYMTALKIMNM